jgi:hypothetical protein
MAGQSWGEQPAAQRICLQLVPLRLTGRTAK